MPVVEEYLQRVISNLPQVGDIHVLLAYLEYGLVRTVSPDLRRRGINPKILAGEAKACAVIESDFQKSRLLVEFDLGRQGSGIHV